MEAVLPKNKSVNQEKKETSKEEEFHSRQDMIKDVEEDP